MSQSTTERMRSWGMKEVAVARGLKPLLKSHKVAITAAVFLGTVATLSEGLGIGLFIPLVYSLDETTFGAVGDDWLGRFSQQIFISVPPSNRFLVILLSIFTLVFLKNCLSYGRVALSSWVDTRVVHDLRCRVLERLFRFNIRFIDRSRSGRLFNALEHQTWETGVAVAKVVDLAINLCGIVVLSTLLLLISWRMTLMVALSLALISTIVRLMARRVESLSRAGTKAWDALSQRILEIFRGMRTIRAFGQESRERDLFGTVSSHLSRVDFEQRLLTGLVGPVSEVLIAALLVAILYAGNRAGSNLPAVLTFIFILYRLQPKIRRLDQARLTLIASTAPVEVVMSVLNDEGNLIAHSGSLPFSELQDGILLQSVTFQYEPNDPPALRDVSIQIPKERMTALVGPSGAGKSTLVNLLLRFHEPTSGEILIDGAPLRHLELASWRGRVSVVSQDVHLFNTTIRDNIAYGRLKGATDKEIVEASRIADADKFVRALPEGYETNVGDQGVRLSAGEKQRIALARAVVRRPEILILDEATNSVDSLSEQEIQRALDHFREGQTVLVVAHRLSTIERADHIIVLDAGRVREQGDLHHLLELDGFFARLFKRQHRAVTS